jgi:hypothetical protein
MNKSFWMLALLAPLALVACDKQPVVVNVPSTVPGPPGPAGATGATGATGDQGTKGNTGTAGGATTVIVMPPASAPSN